MDMEMLAQPEIIKAMIQEFKPVIGTICKEVLEGMKTLNEQEDFFTEIGKLSYNTYQGYIRAGFSANEAMILLLKDKERYVEMFQKSMNNVGKNR